MYNHVSQDGTIGTACRMCVDCCMYLEAGMQLKMLSKERR